MHEKQTMLTGKIVENREVALGHFQMAVQLPHSFPTPLPGQFVMIRKAEQEEPLLARPLSVFGFQLYEDHIKLQLLYRVAGRGTKHLACSRPGDELSVLGPLGKGFTLPTGIRRVIFIAGGVGVAPLTFLLHSGLLSSGTELEIQKTFYLGARSAELLAGLDRLEGFCELEICTDDGSRGYHGPVTAMFESDIGLLKRDIGGYNPEETMIYACGPMAMIRAIGLLLNEHPIRCQVSLEERMACGLGACLGCAVAIRNEVGERDYRRVCRDGPVFDLREIIFAAPSWYVMGKENG
jgi:dihydroorotate dehydrogenase electron transfer subunit